MPEIPEPGPLDAAAQAHVADVDALGEMTPEQLDYLARVADLPDPLTDGLECEGI
jgi:hypothetical protein